MSCCTDKKSLRASKRLLSVHRAGVALVLVLGLITLLTWMSLEVLAGIRKELAVQPDQRSQSRLEATAYQLLEISIGVVAEIKHFEGGIYSPAQGWAAPLAYVGLEETERPTIQALPYRKKPAAETTDAESSSGTGAPSLLEELEAELDTDEDAEGKSTRVVSLNPETNRAPIGIDTAVFALPEGIRAHVRLYDETGKLPIEHTSEERWLLFFQEMEFEEFQAKQLTDSLLDWMDKDKKERPDGAESTTYRLREPPYAAANRRLRSFDELRLIKGFDVLFFTEEGLPNESFQTFARNVSLYHSGDINLNTASELILATLAEEREFEEQSVLDYLAGDDMTFGTEDDRILQPGLEEDDLPRDNNGELLPVSKGIPILRVEITVSNGRSLFYLNALLDIEKTSPGGIYPFAIRELRVNEPLAENRI